MARISKKGPDQTCVRSHIRRIKNMIQDYELVKSKRHPQYKTVKELFDSLRFPRQNFYKYYKRFLSSHRSDESLIPLIRGRAAGYTYSAYHFPRDR